MVEKGFDRKRSEPFSISEIHTLVFSFCIQYNEVTKYKEASIWKQILKILAIVIHNKAIIFCQILRYLMKTKGKSVCGNEAQTLFEIKSSSALLQSSYIG